MDNKQMYVYCGECRQGTVGMQTDLVDVNGDPLYVGDMIVPCSIVNGDLASTLILTAVVSDEFHTFVTTGGKEHRRKKGKIKFYIMGLEHASFNEKDKNGWRILRFKKHHEVVDGEKWRQFGFNYKLEEAAD